MPEDPGPLQVRDGGAGGAPGRGAAAGAGATHPGGVRHQHLPDPTHEVSPLIDTLDSTSDNFLAMYVTIGKVTPHSNNLQFCFLDISLLYSSRSHLKALRGFSRK